MDRDESRHSIHEIGLARQVMLALGRAELVTVSNQSLRDGGQSRPKPIPEEDSHDFEPGQHHYDEVEGESLSVFGETMSPAHC
ncbi:hypothetical protein VTH06DRAFT_1025 [Thermothelomyces fergusii]